MPKVTRIIAILLVVLAVVLAIVAFSIGRRASQPAPAPVANHDNQRPAAPQGVPVVLTAAALPAGVPIAPESLRVETWPQRPQGGFGRVEVLAGDIPLQDIPAGVPLTADLLAHGVTMQLKPGERALAVPVDEVAGAGNRIVPGDYVDVFLNLKDQPDNPARSGSPRAGNEDSQMRLLLSRLRVLAYGTRDLPVLQRGGIDAQPAQASSSGNRSTAFFGERTARQVDTSTANLARTAVLAVPVDEAGSLLLGAQSGKLFLALRHPTDPGMPDDKLFPQPRSVLSPLPKLTAEQRSALDSPENHAYAGIDFAALAGHGNVRPPAAAPARIKPSASPGIEIIRGDGVNAARATRSTSL